MKKTLIMASTLLITTGLAAQDATYTITVNEPEHGTLVFEPALPDNEQLPAGTILQVTATADSGYAVDTVYGAVPGGFGVQYLESMERKLELTVDQDITVGALFLPESEFQGFSVRQDIVYAQPGIKPLKYDVWTPEDADNLPIIVIIHGGGWRANTEDIMRGMAREMVRTGRYVVASIDYRWSGNGDGEGESNSMADIIGDVFGAIAHIQEHADTYGGDATRIAVTGDSAGGHLSAAAGTMPQLIGDGGFGVQQGVFEFMPSYLPAGKSVDRVREEITAAVQAAAPSYGVFSNEGYDGGVGLQHYSSDADADENWSAAIAPIHHIPAIEDRAIPHYLTRGTRDPLISTVMVTEYAKALADKNQRVRYDEVPNASHAFFDWKPDQQTRNVFAQFGVPYIREMVNFFDAVFYPQP